MNRPYTICHMMMALDGRIDCAMTEKLKGVEHYYTALHELNTPTTVSGKVTAQLEMALSGEFKANSTEMFGKEGFSKKTDSEGYEVIVDTKGTLLWADDENRTKPRLIITSEQVTKEYLAYLDLKNISWIVCGKAGIDLARASEILAHEFRVKRMAVVGGGHINGGFLEAGLLDEISLLIGAGVDGREGMAGVFDGRPMQSSIIDLKLEKLDSFDDGSIWIRYRID